jgi:hypothetical protein
MQVEQAILALRIPANVSRLTDAQIQNFIAQLTALRDRALGAGVIGEDTHGTNRIINNYMANLTREQNARRDMAAAPAKPAGAPAAPANAAVDQFIQEARRLQIPDDASRFDNGQIQTRLAEARALRDAAMAAGTIGKHTPEATRIIDMVIVGLINEQNTRRRVPPVMPGVPAKPAAKLAGKAAGAPAAPPPVPPAKPAAKLAGKPAGVPADMPARDVREYLAFVNEIQGLHIPINDNPADTTNAQLEGWLNQLVQIRNRAQGAALHPVDRAALQYTLTTTENNVRRRLEGRGYTVNADDTLAPPPAAPVPDAAPVEPAAKPRIPYPPLKTTHPQILLEGFILNKWGEHIKLPDRMAPLDQQIELGPLNTYIRIGQTDVFVNPPLGVIEEARKNPAVVVYCHLPDYRPTNMDDWSSYRVSSECIRRNWGEHMQVRNASPLTSQMEVHVGEIFLRVSDTTIFRNPPARVIDALKGNPHVKVEEIV